MTYSEEPLTENLARKPNTVIGGMVLVPGADLLRKNVNYHWGTYQQKAFETLKEKLVIEPIIKQPDLNQLFILHTDISGYRLSAILF
ncbi:hypothetical protein G9A89_001190 [Geosiphon pyriformis]|nr:hypothetical protein G9A89_001190 [Geosiphon pyriformis]